MRIGHWRGSRSISPRTEHQYAPAGPHGVFLRRQSKTHILYSALRSSVCWHSSHQHEGNDHQLSIKLPTVSTATVLAHFRYLWEVLAVWPLCDRHWLRTVSSWWRHTATYSDHCSELQWTYRSDKWGKAGKYERRLNISSRPVQTAETQPSKSSAPLTL